MSRAISIIGCGWLGLPLGAFLVKKGFVVKGSTTRSEKIPLLKENGIDPFVINISEDLDDPNIDPFFQSEILIINIPPGRRRQDVEEVHPKEIQNLIKKAKSVPIKKIIFVSSIGVYGNSNGTVTEEDTPNPVSPSGKALTKIEAFLKAQKQFDSTILRMSGLVGGDRKAGRFLAGKKDVPNGKAPVNLVHLDDCIQVIYQVLEQNCWNETFNVCSDEHPNREEFYIHQAKKQGFEPPQFLKSEEVNFKIISNEKLKKKLDYSFLHPNPMLF